MLAAADGGWDARIAAADADQGSDHEQLRACRRQLRREQQVNQELGRRLAQLRSKLSLERQERKRLESLLRVHCPHVLDTRPALAPAGALDASNAARTDGDARAPASMIMSPIQISAPGPGSATSVNSVSVTDCSAPPGPGALSPSAPSASPCPSDALTEGGRSARPRKQPLAEMFVAAGAARDVVLPAGLRSVSLQPQVLLRLPVNGNAPEVDLAEFCFSNGAEAERVSMNSSMRCARRCSARCACCALLTGRSELHGLMFPTSQRVRGAHFFVFLLSGLGGGSDGTDELFGVCVTSREMLTQVRALAAERPRAFLIAAAAAAAARAGAPLCRPPVLVPVVQAAVVRAAL